MESHFSPRCHSCHARKTGRFFSRTGISLETTLTGEMRRHLEPLHGDIFAREQGRLNFFTLGGRGEPPGTLLQATRRFLDDNRGQMDVASALYSGFYYSLLNFFHEPGFDPFSREKHLANQAGLRAFKAIMSRPAEAGPAALEKAIMEKYIPMALAANFLQDYASSETVDNTESLDSMLALAPLEYTNYVVANERKELLRELEKAKGVVFVPDNAGEFLLDLVLLDRILRRFTGLKVWLVHRPLVVNDITGREIRELLGLAEIKAHIDVSRFEEVSSGQLAGSFSLQNATGDSLFDLLSDPGKLILAKGQANLEILPWLPTLHDPASARTIDFPARRTYLLARAKCAVAVESLNLRYGTQAATRPIPPYVVARADRLNPG